MKFADMSWSMEFSNHLRGYNRPPYSTGSDADAFGDAVKE